ncbi:hypothetical protein [Corallincola luteus]|uniref:hypothetical protein n=1 Tax=Corallincola luteus TaxID=1775177 RepID=UPI00196B7D20|nr:hypothetical protein [Corallincola luteus]
MFRTLIAMVFLCVSLVSAVLANDVNKLTIEEQRLPDAEKAMTGLLAPFAKPLAAIARLDTSNTLDQIADIGREGFNIGKRIAQQQADDRPLYWFRLAANAKFRSLDLPAETKAQWIDRFELESRGFGTAVFSKAKIRILVTGFDPFFLDRHIDQSNPSGLAALLLDNELLTADGTSAEVQAVMIPVRFADFDAGMIEKLLMPYFKYNKVDMVVTISMGRDGFDLERFPGLRRSAEAPGNLNVLTGATSQAPLVPLLQGQPLRGPEFLEYSLPAAEMISLAQEMNAPFPVTDNRNVETLTGKKSPASLAELKGETSVQGSGGGYLSNEISYRSIRLRNLIGSKVPVGHIHTPKVKAYDKEKELQIVDQIKLMLAAAIPTLH